MVSALIFSKDRACQLELLLRSIDENCPNLFNKIIILWNYSNIEYLGGYQKLEEECRYNKCQFLCERNDDHCLDNFRDEVRRLVKLSEDYISFLTDDTVFHREFEFDTNHPLVQKFCQEEKSVFSLRLGYNTVVQDIHAKPEPTKQPYLHMAICVDGVLKWNPKFYHSTKNYGYPFSIDGHIYHKKFLSDLINQIDFKTTNQLESGLFNYHNLVHKMYAYIYSCCVNIPCNNLSLVTVAGKYHPFTTKELNDAFLSGKRISMNSIRRANIEGCHQEIELLLE